MEFTQNIQNSEHIYIRLQQIVRKYAKLIPSDKMLYILVIIEYIKENEFNCKLDIYMDYIKYALMLEQTHSDTTNYKISKYIPHMDNDIYQSLQTVESGKQFFKKLDINNDGFITPKNILKINKINKLHPMAFTDDIIEVLIELLIQHNNKIDFKIFFENID